MGAPCLKPRIGWGWVCVEMLTPQFWPSFMVCRGLMEVGSQRWKFRGEWIYDEWIEGWMHEGKWSGPWGHPPDTVNITEPGISSPSVFSPPTNDKNNSLRISSLAQFRPAKDSHQIYNSYKGGSQGTTLSLWVRSSNCSGKSNSLSEGLNITQSFVTWVLTLRSTLKVGTLGRVEIYGVKFSHLGVSDQVPCTSCHPFPLLPALPLHHLSDTLLFLHWYRRILFVLWWDGKVVRPGGGQMRGENQYFCTQGWEHKKREGTRVQEQGHL